MGEVYFEERVPTTHAVFTGNIRSMRLLPDYFSFGPVIGDFFIRLVALTSSLSRRFIQFLEDLVCRDVDKCLQDAAVPFSGRHVKSFSSVYQSKFEECMMPSNTFGSSTNFQVHERRSPFPKGNSSVNMSSTTVEAKHTLWDMQSIFHGLMLPPFGFRLAWKVASACFEVSSIHVSHIQMRVQSFISRVHRTLHGSSDDIGWLQQTPGFAPVQDGTTRFMELLNNIRNGEHTLPNSFVYLLVPGLFSNHSPLYFVSTKRFFSKMGLTCHIAKIHSEASVERNAWELKQYIDELYWGSGKRVLLLGHSKGGVDAAAALSLYWSVLKDKVGGLALVQSPYGGTPIASDILREGQIADKEARRIMEFVICKLIKVITRGYTMWAHLCAQMGDIRALEDLTYEKRKEFVMKQKLPEQVPIVSFHSEASIAPGVLATMSHIAHAELPWLPLPSFSHEELESSQAGHKLPVIIPLAAAMAVCALHLRLRYGEKSDGVVTCRDAEVPGSVVVRPDRKLDHAWMVYSSWKKEADEPDASEMCEALLTLLVEIGKMKQNNVQEDGR